MKKNFVYVLILCMFSAESVLALSLDTSVDAEIKNKYEYNKLNEDVLPTLPNHLKNSATEPNSASNSVNKTTSSNVVQNVVKQVQTNIGTRIPSGTKFYAKSNVKISNWNSKNSVISFTTISPVYKNSLTIPQGTVLKGIIAVSHNAQLAGNGGLLELKITSMTFSGKTIPVQGKITKVNSQNIFFNRIKGKRQFLTGVENQIKKGNNFYKKTKNIASKMQQNSVGTVLSPVPILTGWAGSVLMTAISPLGGIFQKGQNVSIPQGTEFEIKLTADAYY